MVFSSVTFLYFFLPIFLFCYFVPQETRRRNSVLLVFSIIFYAWGGLANLIVLAVSVVANFVFARRIEARTDRPRAIALCAAVAVNVGGLVAFKYLGFLAENLNELLTPLGVALPVVHPPLPLGISFFTFHAISYLVDVYRRRVRANERLEEVAVYMTMFPQLVAGPIVRYATIGHRIRQRRTTFGRVSAGLRIFVIGLSWKVLIADAMAPVVAVAFDQTAAPSLQDAWLGLTAYALQIYFDFGGYSNMAIGLALAMGLKFPRNFNLPYGALSITDFWRRWHMSLSSWFRDYVYIPLGGNRRGHMHTAVNLWTVFLLCGLWHGASWNFVIWGIHHGSFLVLERTRFGALLARSPRMIAHAYTLGVVLTGWVWFRTDTLPQAVGMFRGLFGLHGMAARSPSLTLELQNMTVLAMGIGWPLAMFGLPRMGGRNLPQRLRLAVFGLFDTGMMALLFVLSVISVGAAAYSPFLYFRF